ncbi:MAG: hypothetical protein WKF37_12915 [Bryobacteraceae bacterium]
MKPIHVDVETKGEFSCGAAVTNQSLTAAQFEARGDRLVLVGFPRVAANAGLTRQWWTAKDSSNDYLSPAK